MRVARHLRIHPRGRRSPGQGVTQRVIRAPYASVPITGNQIPKFQFPMLSRSPRAQISAQLCQTSSQSISQDHDNLAQCLMCVCSHEWKRLAAGSSAELLLHVWDTLRCQRHWRSVYRGSFAIQFIDVYTDYAPNVHCIWLVELARSKWLKQCPSMIAAQRMCERDRTCLIGLVSRHLLRKSEMFGLLNSSTISHISRKDSYFDDMDSLLESLYVRRN